MALSPEQVVAAMYDEGAASYEQHWAPALHRHARDLVTLVPPPAPDESRLVVDVASGAGTLLPRLRELAGPAGKALALDRSLGMLRQIPPGAPRVQADASRLPLADASVDVLALAFVLFLLPDARTAVAEAARVLRPGGWLLAATWGAQTGTGADALVRDALDAADAPPFAELPRSDDLTDSPERMAELLSPHGLVEIHTDSRPLDARFDARSALAMRTGCGVLGWRFSRLPVEKQDAVLTRLAAQVAELDPEDLVDRSEVLLTTARRT